MLAFEISEKKLIFVSKFAPWDRFYSSGKESCFSGLFWDQNVILVLIVHGSAIKICRLDVFPPSISVRCPSMTGGRRLYFRQHIRRMISVLLCSYICRRHMFVVILFYFISISLGVRQRAPPECMSSCW